MTKNYYNVIGVMSGTSLDGIDLASITVTFGDKCEFEIHQSETVTYSYRWINKLKALTSLSLQEIKLLDKEYTTYLGEIISDFIERNKISNLDAVCSHGHTALHQPHNGLTYQIGNLPELATLINQRVVCDFRVEDVALGGQGAPLVPIGDKLLFSDYGYCLNLGGFANVSTEINGDRIAYDICPVNIVLNYYVNQLGLDFDDKGALASEGNINQELLNELNALPFYVLDFPKSLGLEWVQTTIFPIIDIYRLPIKDVLKTFIEHISIQIAKEVNKKRNSTILVTGGGVYNDYFLKRLKFHVKNNIQLPENQIIEFKEAVIFGLLGILKLRNDVNCLRSVTGASKDHSSGKIYCP